MVVTEDWYFLSHRLQLARAARDAGYDVGVASAPGREGNSIVSEGFAYFPFNLQRRSTAPRQELRTILTLAHVFRTFRPTLIHLVAAKPMVYGAIAARLVRIDRLIFAVAGLGYLYLGGGWQRSMMRFLYQETFRRLVAPSRNARVIIQNQDDESLLRRHRLVRQEQILRVPGSGVDINRFCPGPEPSGPIVILMHSRMLWDKGVGELVEAARIMKSQGSTALVRLVGEPDPANPASIPESHLREWASLGIVEWLGARRDIPELLRTAHIACLPSYREGAPLSLIEAAASGKPIVTTDVPGCREIVQHEGNGLLVPPRNASELAKALTRLVGDPELRNRLGKAGRARAELELCHERVNARILALYRELSAEV